VSLIFGTADVRYLRSGGGNEKIRPRVRRNEKKIEQFVVVRYIK